MILYRYLTGVDDNAFCHRVTAALNKGWQLAGPATLTYDTEKKRVICGQPILKEVDGETYDPSIELGKY